MVKITVDGINYESDELSDVGRAQVASLQFVDEEIAKLQNTMAVYQTAQGAYAKALKSGAEKPSRSVHKSAKKVKKK